MEQLLLGLIALYSVLNIFIGIILTIFYYDRKETPITLVKGICEDIETLGILIICILLTPSYVLSTLLYCVVKIFYNTYTIKLWNMKIR